MKKSVLRLSMIILATMFAVVLFTGCFSYPASTPAPAGERQYTSVTFENRTGETIFYLYISERTDNNWGQDWLGSSNVLSNNNSYTVRLLRGVQYDIKATNLSGDISYSFWITVGANSQTFLIEPGDRI